MKKRIAVATVNGRAYYELANELQQKRLPFVSMKPWEPVSANIKVAITTESESSQISHPKILLFELQSNLKSVVDESISFIHGKQCYGRIVVGVDPGKTCELAILGDNKVLETLTTSNMEDTAQLIVASLKRFPSAFRLVRVGDRAPEYTQNLLNLLDSGKPEGVLVEVVPEAGTSQLANKIVNRRVIQDTISAIKITRKKGHVFFRGVIP